MNQQKHFSQSPPRNRNLPAKVSWEKGASRLLNLVIALINENQPRSADWVISHVDGYDSPTPASRRKQLQRDRNTLAQLGLCIEVHHGGNGGELYFLDHEAAFLPELDLTPKQADVLVAAARWTQSGEMSAAAESAYHKLVAAGIRRGLSSSVIASVPDLTDLDQKSIDAIFRALDNGLCITFDYYQSLVGFPTRRTLEPWAYGAVDGKLYVTGWDTQRNAQRTFRISRISDIEVLAQFITHPVPNLPSSELIRQGLNSSGTMVHAVLRFHESSGAEELRLLTDASGAIGPVDRDWLVKTAAAYAPDAVVVEPEDIVSDVVQLLRCATGESFNVAAFQTTKEEAERP
ncbi:WYL domain-containing protein [Corynebacterium sp. 4HC-13]|nr:WYL domain-containing protein [Corynebacterium anserum]